jgi:hypothetical protein
MLFCSLTISTENGAFGVRACSNPADWLATDQPVPLPFRSCDVWHRGRWVDVGTLDEDFDRYRAEPPA